MSFFVKCANNYAQDQLCVFYRLIEKWAEHDEPIIRSQSSF